MHLFFAKELWVMVKQIQYLHARYSFYIKGGCCVHVACNLLAKWAYFNARLSGRLVYKRERERVRTHCDCVLVSVRPRCPVPELQAASLRVGAWGA